MSGCCGPVKVVEITSGGGGGTVLGVTGLDQTLTPPTTTTRSIDIDVDNTDPTNPIVSAQLTPPRGQTAFAGGALDPGGALLQLASIVIPEDGTYEFVLVGEGVVNNAGPNPFNAKVSMEHNAGFLAGPGHSGAEVTPASYSGMVNWAVQEVHAAGDVVVFNASLVQVGNAAVQAGHTGSALASVAWKKIAD